MKSLVVYHGRCNDGFGAAYAAWSKLGDSAEYVPYCHGDEIPKLEGYSHVYFLDMAPSARYLTEVPENINVVVLDHHVSNVRELEGADLPPNVFMNMNVSKSGCVLAWEYFNPGLKVPDLLIHIQDRDLWTNSLEDTASVSSMARAVPFSFTQWDTWVKEGYEDDLAKAKYLEDYLEGLVESVQKNSYMGSFDGHRVPFVNSIPVLASQLGSNLSKGHPFAVVYFDVEGYRQFSLRSSEGGMDVSLIAKKYGGGGHAAASGIRMAIEDIDTVLK